MISAMLLCLDDQASSLRGDFGAQACSGNPAADDHDIEVHGAGYELESPGV